MIKRVLLTCAFIVLGASFSMAQDKITIGGSTTVLPIAQKTAEVYMAKYPEAQLSVSGSGSGDGLKALMDGSIDIANSSRGLKEQETRTAAQNGYTLFPSVIAVDCIVPIVSPENPVQDLSLEQLKNIYNGKIKNWNEVGGEDKVIVVISRDFSSGTFEMWQEKVLGSDRVRSDAQMLSSNGEVAGSVSANKYALGYVGLGYAKGSVKGLRVNGVAASVSTAKDGSYALARELYMFTKGEPAGAVKRFVDFVKSKQGQSIVEEEGFVAID